MMEAKIIYVDMDDVLCDYKNAYALAIQNNPNIKYPQSQTDFFRKLKPIDGAIEGFNYLYKQNIFDVYILSAPSVRNPLCYLEKRLWVEDHFGLDVARKLIIATNKGLLKGDFLIDDMVNGRGQENFEGEIIHFVPAKQINQKAVKVMAEAGIDISSHYPKQVDKYINDEWDYVITVCDDANETCPVFIGKVKHRLHIGFEDPSHAKGTDEFIWSEFHRVRDEIKEGFYKFYVENIKNKQYAI